MPKALFINGVFEDTLKEISEMQDSEPSQYGYLQPYSSRPIKLLAKTRPPTPEHPTTLYLSLTSSLDRVSYIAKIVEWKDKRLLTLKERDELNKQIKNYQPSETDGIYLKVKEKDCVNLIAVHDVKAVDFPISELTKTSDNTRLKAKTTSGGWSVVYERPELVESN